MKIIGHRGARGLAPENTIAGFAQSLACNVDGIEIDVRVTKDGIAVCNHNRTVLRQSGKPLLISQTNYRDLVAAKPDLCTLDDAIQFIAGRVPLMVEIKHGVPTLAVTQTLRTFLARGSKPEDFLIASKHQATLQAACRALPEIEPVIIARFLSIWARRRARQVGARRLVMNHLFVWFGFVQAISKHYQLVVYTVNHPDKIKRWQKSGLYGCITDYPDRFRSGR